MTKLLVTFCFSLRRTWCIKSKIAKYLVFGTDLNLCFQKWPNPTQDKRRALRLQSLRVLWPPPPYNLFLQGFAEMTVWINKMLSRFPEHLRCSEKQCGALSSGIRELNVCSKSLHVHFDDSIFNTLKNAVPS